ncbi:carboxypeptidase-like regulatory domain-containing protein [Flavobacteriaceae bacterium XHP0103]|uniref:carboxypeptidase-like regulatory domain-containing protein n=1 Tax=Marixanthotalea marina TaxID=2844359 RepID=UPI002989E73E|nr:carboxypeptidase-like regulatory domain-containing protein [Marixanthotalea marina]MBU3822175.1 carboxypeptidase-like regulatory domain-containing protein [Marixanthotalea marina]
MRKLIYFVFMLFATATFAQNTGMVVGKVMDKELNNSPLVLANVSVKGTSIEAETDLTGLFVLENLEAGDYTLVCSFVGYETQEINVHVDALRPAELKLALAASTVSADDLAAITSLVQNETAIPTTGFN